MSDSEQRIRDSLVRAAESAPIVHDLATAARTRARRRRRGRSAAAGVAVAVVAVPVALLAALDGFSGDGDSAGDPPPLPEDRTTVTCGGGTTWPVSAMSDGVALPRSVTPKDVQVAFADMLSEFEMDARALLGSGSPEDVRWIPLAADSSRVTVGTGSWSSNGPDPGAHVVTFARTERGLEFKHGGDCSLEIALPPGRSRVQVVAPEVGIDPTATEVTLLATEIECASGRDPRPFLGEPKVVETADRVIVTLTSEQPESATCPGAAPVPVTIQLAAPLGDRALFDGGTWPYTPITTEPKD